MTNFHYWKKQEQKFTRLTKTAAIPSANLTRVDFVDIKKKTDFDKIPNKAGCYWIWTNEKIIHVFHTGKIPKKITNNINGKKIGEIIYNGIAQNIHTRVTDHLLADTNAGWSGISMDIYFDRVKSHKKKAMSKKGKVPYITSIPIRTKELLLEVNLSQKEKSYIRKSSKKKFYFRNGINIFEPKHRKYKFRLYYISEIDPLYINFLEKAWRKKYGLPRLCFYKEGR